MESQQIHKRYLPRIFRRSPSVAVALPPEQERGDRRVSKELPVDSQAPGSRASIYRSERSTTPHIEYAVFAATWTAVSPTSPAHSASIHALDQSCIFRKNESTVDTLTAATRILSVMEDLSQVVDLAPVKVIKGSLYVVRFILTSVLNSLKHDNDCVDLVVRCGRVWLAMYRGSGGMNEDVLNSPLGRALMDLDGIKSAVVLRILEPSNRLTGMTTASFDQDKINFWNRELDLAIQHFGIEFLAATGVYVAKRASNATTPMKRDDNAPEVRSLPPCPNMLHGRNEVVGEVVIAITNHKQTVLLGMGGIGKTSIAVTALYNEAVILKFGDRRHFVPCDELGDDVNIDSLLQLIAKSVGFKLRGTNQAPLLKFLSKFPILLALDNAETILDHPQSYDAILPLISMLASTENISLIVTSRSTGLPADVPWNMVDVKLLSPDAAKHMLLSFHRFKDCDELSELLKHLGYHPLSIKLIAQVGVQGRLSGPELLKRWNKYQTKLLHLRGVGRQSSLATSLDMSLNSPSLLHPPVARNVLRTLAFLPQGVNELNIQALFPSIEEIDLIMDSLSQLSLIEKRHNRITLLPPISSYIQECIPPMRELMDDIAVYYCDTLIALSGYWYENSKFKTAKLFICKEDANCETVLINLVNNQHSDAYSTAAMFFYLLDIHQRQKKTKLANIIRDLDETDDLGYITCLAAVGWLEFQMANYQEAEIILNRAHRLSVNVGCEQAADDTACSLGALHLYTSNYDDAEAFLLRGGSLRSSGGNRRLAAVYRLQGHLVKARSFANNAIARSRELQDMTSLAWCLLELGQIEWASKNIPAAKSCFTQASDEATKLGDNYVFLKCDQLLATVAIDEGDYFRAQILLEGSQKAAASQNDPHDASLCDVYLGLIQERLLHYESAKALYQKARDEIVQIGSKYDAADCAHYLGGLEKNLGDSEVAVKWFLLAGEEFVGIKVVHRARNCAALIRGLAEDMVLRGNHDAAKRAFVNAEELYSKINDCRGVAGAAEREEELSLGD